MQEYWSFKDSIITAELVLLRILKFDLNVDLPFGHMAVIMGNLVRDDGVFLPVIYPKFCPNWLIPQFFAKLRDRPIGKNGMP